jgi:hypothetical protein
LGQSPLNPGDAFEVALLNAQTRQSLISPISNLTQTDSLLNLQNSGQLYRTTATYLSDLPDADDRANAFRLARPRTVTIDVRRSSRVMAMRFASAETHPTLDIRLQFNHIPDVGCVVPQGNASPDKINQWIAIE